MFLILLILIIVCGLGFVYMNLQKKISKQKNQITFLVRNNNDLKENLSAQNLYRNSSNNSKNIKFFEYSYPSFKTGLIKENCFMYISPFDDSPIVSQLQANILVELEDSITINEQTWYEINLSKSPRINSKGWIKKENVLEQQSY